MEIEEKIKKLEEYKSIARAWKETYNLEMRSFLNQNLAWVRRELIEVGCFHTMTISPPPAVGGLVMRSVDPLKMMFDPPYGANLSSVVTDMIDQAIGMLLSGPVEENKKESTGKIEMDSQEGYIFIAMPIDPDDPKLEDLLDAIKEAADRCGLLAERVDEPEYNERITDRILESINKAEYVIVDLTSPKPNVFYEAGYAQGLGKTPIYIARSGTKLEFDLKDYPVIFFKNMKQLKDLLKKRLRGLAKARTKT